MQLQVTAESYSNVPSSQIRTGGAGEDLVSNCPNMLSVFCRDLAWTPFLPGELFSSSSALNCLGVVAGLTFISLEGQPLTALYLIPTWRLERYTVQNLLDKCAFHPARWREMSVTSLLNCILCPQEIATFDEDCIISITKKEMSNISSCCCT